MGQEKPLCSGAVWGDKLGLSAASLPTIHQAMATLAVGGLEESVAGQRQPFFMEKAETTRSFPFLKISFSDLKKYTKCIQKGTGKYRTDKRKVH